MKYGIKSNEPQNLLEEKQKILKKIGERAKKMRIEAGHKSAEKFAYEHGFDRAQFNRYEQGKIDMQISSLIKLLIALDVDIKTFFSEGFDADAPAEKPKKNTKKK